MALAKFLFLLLYSIEGEGPEGMVIGEEAYRSMKIYPETTIRSIKKNGNQ